MITLLLALSVIAVAGLLALVSFVQLLYLESQRLITRDFAALEFFKETLQDLIGLDANEGALAFSIQKHTLLALQGVLLMTLTVDHQPNLLAPFLQACGLTLLMMFSATYIVPHLLYRRTVGRWLVPLAPLLRMLALTARPVVAMLVFVQSIAELGHPEPPTEDQASSVENIEALIDAGAEEGILEEDDRKLIHSVVAFGDKTVREVMTPRPNIVAISEDKSLEDLRQLVIHEQYSRIPVFTGTIDHVIGFVHVRDMFELDQRERQHRRVRDLVRPMRFVPETKPVTDLLREMQADGAHMVVVVDEYGNTAGLATMEDLVEEILGEIRDEHEPTRDVQPEPGGSYVVSGSFDLDNLADLIGFRPQQETESTTVGGLVTEWLGHVPHVGDTIDREGIHIEILAGNELRVEQVRISKSHQDVHVERTRA